MKDRTFINVLLFILVLFIALSVYQVLVIKNLESDLEMVSVDRDRIIEKYNQEKKDGK